MTDWHCLLCHETKYVQVATKVRDSDSHGVVECRCCGHVQLSPVPTHEELLTYYKAETQRKAVLGHLDRDQKREHVRADTERRVALVERLVGEVGTEACSVLDIGSGDGFFVEAMQQRGHLACGIDLKNESHIHAEIIDPFIVTMFHVLEHVIDPVEFVGRYFDLSKHALVIEVPSHSDPMIRANAAYAAWHYQRAHIHYFDIVTIYQVFLGLPEKLDFTVEMIPVQRYSLDAVMHWQHHNEPLINKPIGWAGGDLGELDKAFREKREQEYSTDTMCLVLRKM